MNSPTPPTAAREQLPLGTDDAAYYDAGPDPAPAPATQGSEMTYVELRASHAALLAALKVAREYVAEARSCFVSDRTEGGDSPLTGAENDALIRIDADLALIDRALTPH